jgi:hypothetical protein
MQSAFKPLGLTIENLKVSIGLHASVVIKFWTIKHRALYQVGIDTLNKDINGFDFLSRNSSCSPGPFRINYDLIILDLIRGFSAFFLLCLLRWFHQCLWVEWSSFLADKTFSFQSGAPRAKIGDVNCCLKLLRFPIELLRLLPSRGLVCYSALVVERLTTKPNAKESAFGSITDCTKTR